MDEEQDLEGKANAKTLLAHALLAGSGGYGLSLSQPKFAGPAFGVSLVAGFIGFIANATDEDTLIKIHRYTSGLCRCLEVPLIASEICLSNGIQLELAALNLLYPSIHYLAKYIFKKDDVANPSVLELSHAISVCAIAYFNFIHENWWGVGLAVVCAMSSFGQNIIDEPQMPTALLATGEDTLIKIHRYTSGLCRCLEVPLIAAEICLENCIPIELAALHLLYPSIHYLAKYIFKRDDLANQCFLETSHTISVCAIAYFNYINENWWGVGLAVVYAMSCFGQKIIDEPQMPTALLGIGNFLYILKAS